MDERETDGFGPKRRSIPMLGKGEAPDSWCSCEPQFPLPVPMRACLSFPVCSCGSTLSAGALHLPESWLPQLLHARLPSTVPLRSVFCLTGYHAASLPVYPVCSEDARMFRKKIAQQNARSWQRLNSPRLCTPAIPAWQWVWKVQTTQFWFTPRNDASTNGVFQSRYIFCTNLCLLAATSLPQPCVSFNISKQSEWCVPRAVARCESALLLVISVAGMCARVFQMRLATSSHLISSHLQLLSVLMMLSDMGSEECLMSFLYLHLHVHTTSTTKHAPQDKTNCQTMVARNRTSN